MLEEELFSKLKKLSETTWDGLGRRQSVNNWLGNFDDKYRIHALYLITHFMFFNDFQVKEMLKSIYRDLFRYPIISQIRKSNNDTLDSNLIEAEFKKVLNNTRFLAVGSSGESSQHLTYPFLQVNNLHKDYSIYENQIEETIKKYPSVTTFNFIDDLAGTGTQASKYLKEKIEGILSINSNIKFNYYILISTKEAKENLIGLNIFDNVKSVFELDETFKVFHKNSRYFGDFTPNEIDKVLLETIFAIEGKKLYESIWEIETTNEEIISKNSNRDELGFKNSQLLLGFKHNTPSNTLPVIWYNESMISWCPMFKRHNKIYKSPFK